MPRANRFFHRVVFGKEIKVVIDERHMFQETPELTGLILMVKRVV